ncbi:transposase [Clostridium polynesiense]|uniref:transposase n=1 Tax=Clostridium polynesiense TaxID=1325933 RepID=UPI00058CE628|nr:transposase [Clostridium polynesiense]
MPTKRRVWFPGCMYHITARGTHKEPIFKSYSDFYMYLRMLQECLDYYEEQEYELLGYCLMSNHVHLLIRSGKSHIGDFMRKLHSMYALYFNNKYEVSGHLYEERYFSEVIMDSAQLMEASRYVHLNPVRANIVNNPQDYEFSSYNMYIGKEEENFIKTQMILGFFPEKHKRRKYRNFVEKGIEAS